jgi:hypothetical protein
MLKIYIAGPYCSDSVIGGLNNIRNGLRAATELMMAGYSPYCPFTDFLFCLQLRENETLSLDDYYNASIEWLYVSDAVLVLPGYEKSKGVLHEIEKALLRNIPVFYSIGDLQRKFPIVKSNTRCHDCHWNISKSAPFIKCKLKENPNQGYGCSKGIPK